MFGLILHCNLKAGIIASKMQLLPKNRQFDWVVEQIDWEVGQFDDASVMS